MARLKSFISNLFGCRSSVGQASQQSAASEASKSKFRAKAAQTMKYVVMHSYRAKQKRKHRNKNSKFLSKLSYVSAAILEEYGEILSRRERRSKSRRMVTPFQPYYN